MFSLIEAVIKNRIKKSKSEVDLLVENESEIKKLKIFNVDGIKEKQILKFIETQSLLSECSFSFIYPSKIHQLNNNVIYERSYYSCDLKSIIYTKCLSLSEISSIMIKLSNILIILCECDIYVSNVKSSNIVYENNEVKLVDLCLNELRREEEMKLSNYFIISPEELLGNELNEKSVIWSIGCILYEMLNKELPFNEENVVNKTLNNIMRCKLNDDIKVDDKMMKEMLLRMLKVRNEDRLSLMEFKKEMIKENEILKDSENNLMIKEERKGMLFNNGFIIYPLEYYLNSEKWEEIRDDLIERYNYKSNEKILSILLIMKLYKSDWRIQNKLKFQIYHQCKESGKECNLDKMIFNIKINNNDKEKFVINSDCVCLCEEGIEYFFRILNLINQTKLSFYIDIPIQSQPLFGLCFSQLSKLQELYLSRCHLTFHFIESFIKSIPFMNKLKCVELQLNPIGLIGFKLLLTYLHLFINKNNELYLREMKLDDESMILLSSELYKYPILQKINITDNKNIHSIGLKSLFSKFPISKIKFDFNGSKELLIDKNIPQLIQFIKDEYNGLNLIDSKIDDAFFKSFISLRLNELRVITKLDLRNNKLTSKSVEILINNLSSLPYLKHLELYGNPIGDVGMKLLAPHIQLLKDWKGISCSKMGLSSDGLIYLLYRLKNIHEKIKLDISENYIYSSGIEYLSNYMKENNNIEKMEIHNNPIGNAGFRLLLNSLNMLIDDDEMNLSNISFDDESVILLAYQIYSIKNCSTIILKENRIRIKGLKSICERTLKNDKYPFIEMKCSNWTNKEFEYYLNYCIKKKRINDYDFSNLNLNDSYISLIKQINYKRLDLSNNKISFKGLKELTDSLPKYSYYISIFGNEIGDEGIEIICKYFDKFVYYSSLNLSNIRMSFKGLKMLIEKLKDYEQSLIKINISGNELNEEGLRLVKENKEVFDCLYELSITMKENINRNELKSFLKTFSTIGIIKLDGISEEEKKELSKEFINIQ